MIIINDIEEVEKYKVEQVTPNDEDKEYVRTIIYYEFKINGKLQDVEFNVKVPFGIFELQSKNKKEIVKNIEPFELKFEQPPLFDYYVFIAKNVKMNKGGGLYMLVAQSLLFAGECRIEALVVKREIIGDKLFARNISYVKRVICDEVEVEEDISCKNISANILTLGNYYLKDVNSSINTP